MLAGRREFGKPIFMDAAKARTHSPSSGLPAVELEAHVEEADAAVPAPLRWSGKRARTKKLESKKHKEQDLDVEIDLEVVVQKVKKLKITGLKLKTTALVSVDLEPTTLKALEIDSTVDEDTSRMSALADVYYSHLLALADVAQPSDKVVNP